MTRTEKIKWKFIWAWLTIAPLLGGCTISGPQPHAFGMGFPLIATAAVVDSLTEPDYPQPEAQYAALPPCVHPGDEQQMHVPGTPKCSRRHEPHVAYWTSRPDKQKIACKGQHADYCNAESGMSPHCHGFGKFRFCHSHPGGDQAHDHMHDQEFASNATPEPRGGRTQ